jgi:hypothetical protein
VSRARLVRREALTADDRRSMRQLLAAHFEGVTPAAFARDLEEKNWVVLLEEAGRLTGFTTLLTYETSAGGEPVAVVYSGDTVVERGARGSAALPQAWIAAVRALHEEGGAAAPSTPAARASTAPAAPARAAPAAPASTAIAAPAFTVPPAPALSAPAAEVAAPGRRRRLYWLLLTSGFRTYRFLPVFWRDFAPRPGPGARHALLDALARERLGGRYLPELGVARLATPQVLARDLREVPTARRADPYVAFFLARNPGWEAGDELVCLTEIAEANLTAAGRRMWQRGHIEHPLAVAAEEAAR